jgi:hypothetical protein
MSKTIAEQLVETTARLMAAPVTMESGYPGNSAYAEASAIVASVYGPPCAAFTHVYYPGTPRPSDECRICGWPRGHHAQAPGGIVCAKCGTYSHQTTCPACGVEVPR